MFIIAESRRGGDKGYIETVLSTHFSVNLKLQRKKQRFDLNTFFHLFLAVEQSVRNEKLFLLLLPHSLHLY